MKSSLRLLVCGCIALLALGAAGAEEGLTGIEAFAMDPAMTQASVSPDGNHIATMQRLTKDGNPILMIYDANNLAKKPVRLGASQMEISSFGWVNKDRLIVRLVQELDTLGGNRISKLAIVDKEGKAWLDVPRNRSDRRSEVSEARQKFSGAAIVNMLPKQPRHILLAYDDDQNGIIDIFQVNVVTGAAKRIVRNSSKIAVQSVDEDGEPRLTSRYDSGDEAIIYLARLKGDKEWIEIGRTEASLENESRIFGALGVIDGPDSNRFYVLSNHETDTAAIYEYDLEKMAFGEMLFHHPTYDALGIVRVRDENKVPKLVGFTYSGKAGDIYFTDPDAKALQDSIDQALPGTTNRIVSRSDDHNTLIIRAEGPRMPPTWYLLKGNKMSLLGSSLPFLKPKDLADVKWVKYKARDGMEIRSLVTVPNGEGPFPMVIHPHGGPVARDYWGFDLWAQMMAYHGYVVIQPQFRISEGFGRKHLESGYARWGYELQDDLEDAAKYLVETELGDPKRQAIFGWSYGGYAAFVGSFRDPNPFHCAIAGAGVSDIPYFRAWLGDFGSFTQRTYRHTADGINPLEHVESVDIPILVIHGSNDTRVPVSHSHKFVAELEKHGKQHKYVELAGAGHFFGTIYYHHHMEMFTAIVDWLDNTCGLKPTGNVAGAGD